MFKIIVSPFCKDRDQSSCDVPLESKLPEILANFDQAKPGYRDGVVLVPIGVDGFRARMVVLKQGVKFQGVYQSRFGDELPRKEIRALPGSMAAPVLAVSAILYSREALLENNEGSDLSADWEVVAFQARLSEGEQPMPPETLMANHFQDEGGTATGMSPAEFEAALKESYFFWRDKVLLPSD